MIRKVLLASVGLICGCLFLFSCQGESPNPEQEEKKRMAHQMTITVTEKLNISRAMIEKKDWISAGKSLSLAEELLGKASGFGIQAQEMSRLESEVEDLKDRYSNQIGGARQNRIEAGAIKRKQKEDKESHRVGDLVTFKGRIISFVEQRLEEDEDMMDWDHMAKYAKVQENVIRANVSWARDRMIEKYGKAYVQQFDDKELVGMVEALTLQRAYQGNR